MSRTRPNRVRFCRIPACQNLLYGQQEGYCGDDHRHQYHTSARLIGQAVISVAGFEAAGLFRRECEVVRGRESGVRRKVKIKIQKPRPEQIDLGALQPQERLGMLCRAAERYGVLV